MLISSPASQHFQTACGDGRCCLLSTDISSTLLAMLGTVSGQEATLVPLGKRSVQASPVSQRAFLSSFMLSLWSCILLDVEQIPSSSLFTWKIYFKKIIPKYLSLCLLVWRKCCNNVAGTVQSCQVCTAQWAHTQSTLTRATPAFWCHWQGQGQGHGETAVFWDVLGNT